MTEEEKIVFKQRAEIRKKKAKEDFDTDIKKDERIEKQICKTCYYLKVGGIVLNALTHASCKGCSKDMTFANSDTDMYCIDCAKLLNVCKKCGSKMD